MQFLKYSMKKGSDYDSFVFKHVIKDSEIMYFYTQRVVLTEDKVSHSCWYNFLSLSTQMLRENRKINPTSFSVV
jgi:hypothetical protein